MGYNPLNAGCQYGKTNELVDFLGNLIFEHALFHPTHGEQIVKGGEQAVPHAVMALAGKSRIVAHLDFRDGVALDLEQRRQEAVHALEKFQVLDALAPERAVGAARVGNFFAGQFIPDRVGDARRGDADKAVAFTARFHARAADAVKIFQRLQKFRQILRVVLQIGVEREEIFAARGLESGKARRALATVEREPLRADARIGGGEFLEDFPRLVPAAIVGDDDLVGNLERLDRLADGSDEFAQIAFLVVTRNDEANFRIFGVHRPNMKT